ncbi:hypothetical protein GCM10009548_87250 [Streptomyces malaysiensis subsp. malaysiensis]
MSGPAGAKRPQRGGVRGGQPGGIGKIRQQPCSGMTDHPRTIGADMNPGTQDSLHVESALRLDRQNPSARFIVPGQEGTFAFLPHHPPYSSETARLGRVSPITIGAR